MSDALGLSIKIIKHELRWRQEVEWDHGSWCLHHIIADENQSEVPHPLCRQKALHEQHIESRVFAYLSSRVAAVPKISTD